MEEFGSFQPGTSLASEGAGIDNTGLTFGGTSGPSSGAAGYGGLQMHSRMMRYDLIVRKLNEARLAGLPFALAHTYLDAVQGFAAAPSSGSAADAGNAARDAVLEQCWRTVVHLVRERDVVNGQFTRTAIRERQYAPDYLDPKRFFEDATGVHLRQTFASGAKAYLEEQ